MLRKEAGCTATALNPGDLRIIRKKAGREGSLKTAERLRGAPEEERRVERFPGEEEEAFRPDITVKEFLKKERAAAANRLRAPYGQAGIIEAAEKDLKGAEGRAARHGELPEGLRGHAGLPEERRALFETRLEGMKEKGAERAKGKELAPHILSVPGIGIEIAAALPACLGTGGGLAVPDRRPVTRDLRRGRIVRGKRSGTGA